MDVRRNHALIVLIVLSFGLIVTLASGLYRRGLSFLGQSIIGYGFPLSWVKEAWLVYPDSSAIYSFCW